MRYAVLSLGICGGLIAAALGMKWISDYNQAQAAV